MKCDLKYIYKKLSMNLQLRSDNEKYLKQSQIERTQCENSVKLTHTKSMIICVPSGDCGTNHFVLGLLLK